jgi:hypothetical protein
MKASPKEYFESYSNLAYNIAGFLAFYLHGDLLICWGLQALGVGSFVYHYQKTANRETNLIWLFDWWAMVFLVNIITGVVCNNEIVWGLLLAYHVIYGYFLLGKMHVFVEVGMSIVPWLVALFFNRPLWVWCSIAGIFLFAVWIRSKDEDPKQLKFHDSAWHSFWHILTALGFYFAVYF